MYLQFALALVYLPEMAGHCGAKRGAEIEMGIRQRAARLSNAGCGYTADSHLARLAIAACVSPWPAIHTKLKQFRIKKPPQRGAAFFIRLDVAV